MSVRAGAAARTTPPLPPPQPGPKQYKSSPVFGRPAALLSLEAGASGAGAAVKQAASASQPVVDRSQLLRLWQRKGGYGGGSGGGGGGHTLLVTGGGAAGAAAAGGGSGVRPRRLLQMLALLLAASGYGLLLASNALVTVQQPPPSPPQPHFQSSPETASLRPLQPATQALSGKGEASQGAAENGAEQQGGLGEMGPEALEAELEERRQLVHKVCAEKGLGRDGKPNAWEFFIDEKHRLVWCNIFKAASTAWLYKFNLLGGYKGSYLRRAVKPQLLLARARYPRPTPDQLLATLPDSLSFLIVREPFERLLSAYRNKLEGYRNRYYRKLAREIARRPRRPPPPTSFVPPPVTAYGDADQRTPGKPPPFSAMLSPTFEQFIDYVIETGLKAEKPHFDEHWAPIHSFCTPCHVNFTVIAKVETLARDEEYIIRRAGIKKALGEKQDTRKITNRARGARATAQLIAEYFATITQEQLRDLYTIYGTDFEMFGYNVTKYYDLARSDVST